MISTRVLVIAWCLTSVPTVVAQSSPSPPIPPEPAELAYDTFCQKEEREKRRLFKAATPDQQSILTRTQIERWREANRARLTEEQLTVVQELWTMASAEMFARTKEGKDKIALFEARARSVFSGRERDEISPYGSCVAAKATK